MSVDVGDREAGDEVLAEIVHRHTLFGSTIILGLMIRTVAHGSVLVFECLVADLVRYTPFVAYSDRMVVEPIAVSTLQVERSARMHNTIACDIEMVPDVIPFVAFDVLMLELRDRVGHARPGGRAMNDNTVYKTRDLHSRLEITALHSEYRCHCSEDGSEELDQPPPLVTLRDRVFLDFIKFCYTHKEIKN